MPEQNNLPAQQAGNGMALTADELALMTQGVATGVETFKPSQVTVPYLIIVQGMSDYVKRGTAQFIDEARVGDIMDNLTLRPMSEAFFVPCKYEDHSTEWKPRRGGLVKMYFTDHSKYFASAKKSADDFDGMPRKTVEGNDITLVPTYTGLLVDPKTGRSRPVVLTMAGTQAKKSRRLNGLIDALTFADAEGFYHPAPIYSQVFRLTTVPEQYQTAEGPATVQGWKIEQMGMTLKMPNGRDIWAHAQEVRKQVEDGVMRMVAPTQGDASVGSIDASTPNRPEAEPTARSVDDNIPFD